MTLFFIIVSIIFMFIIFKMIKRMNNQKFRLKNEPIPTNMGLLISSGNLLAKQLKEAISPTLEENIKYRLLQENPSWTDNDFDWRFFELKRYFMLNSLLHSVPMFSSKVDEVWHEMLMFTREYENFSLNFYGSFLHHTPNLEVTPIPGERAFFDWIYLSLFKPQMNSHLLWGSFLKNPIKKEILKDFEKLSEQQLLHRYFKNSNEWLDIKKYLINKLKTEISQAKKYRANSHPFKKRIKNETDYYHLLPAAIFFSLYLANDYQASMNVLMPVQVNSAVVGGNSGCAGYACGSSSGKESSCSSSSCSSSCSSCGGGCS